MQNCNIGVGSPWAVIDEWARLNYPMAARLFAVLSDSGLRVSALAAPISANPILRQLHPSLLQILCRPQSLLRILKALCSSLLPFSTLAAHLPSPSSYDYYNPFPLKKSKLPVPVPSCSILPKLGSPLSRYGGPSSGPKSTPALPKAVLPRPLRVWSGWWSSYINWSHPLHYHYLKGTKVSQRELDILLHCNGEPAVRLEFEVDEVAYFELPI